MRSLVVLILASAPVAATPAFAQDLSPTLRWTMRDPIAAQSSNPGNLSFRINDVVSDDGSRRKRRAIIAGVDVAPGTTIGIGLFDSLPKARGRGPDPKLDQLSKRSRKAALGMLLRF